MNVPQELEPDWYVLNVITIKDLYFISNVKWWDWRHPRQLKVRRSEGRANKIRNRQIQYGHLCTSYRAGSLFFMLSTMLQKGQLIFSQPHCRKMIRYSSLIPPDLYHSGGVVGRPQGVHCEALCYGVIGSIQAVEVLVARYHWNKVTKLCCLTKHSHQDHL